MRQPVTFLTSSQYYSSAFNAAVFDGPFRIYFAQYQENQALRLYFELQKHLGEDYQRAKTLHSKSHKNIFIMIYPTTDTFKLAFPNLPNGQNFVVRDIEDDFLLGLCGAPEEDDTQRLLDEVQTIVRVWLDTDDIPITPVAVDGPNL